MQIDTITWGRYFCADATADATTEREIARQKMVDDKEVMQDAALYSACSLQQFLKPLFLASKSKL